MSSRLVTWAGAGVIALAAATFGVVAASHGSSRAPVMVPVGDAPVTVVTDAATTSTVMETVPAETTTTATVDQTTTTLHVRTVVTQPSTTTEPAPTTTWVKAGESCSTPGAHGYGNTNMVCDPATMTWQPSGP